MPRPPALSTTTKGLSDRVFAVLLPRIQAHRGTLHALHVGDTYLDPPEVAFSERVTMADHPRMHSYAPPQGLPELLDAIQDRLRTRFHTEVPAEAIQVTLGATGGINVACHALLDPGDEVLLPSPFWPLIRGIIQARGAVPVQIPLYTRLGDADFDVEASLEAAVTPKTTAIYLNSPNNPTGAILSEDDLAAVARVAERHNLWVLTDEVYEELTFGDTPPPCAWSRLDLAHRTIATHSLSKAYGLAGARLGYIHGPTEVMRTIRGLQTFMTYCAAKPMQYAGARALRGSEAERGGGRAQPFELALARVAIRQVIVQPGLLFGGGLPVDVCRQ